MTSMGEIQEEVQEEIVRILDLLRRNLVARGFTQVAVQKRLGWGRSSISDILAGQMTLRVESLHLILEAIGMPPGEFYAELYSWPPLPESASELPRPEPAKEVDRILTRLDEEIRKRSATRVGIERRLGWGRDYISHLMKKQTRLRVAQVLSILSALEIDWREFHWNLYRPDQYKEARRNWGNGLEDTADARADDGSDGRDQPRLRPKGSFGRAGSAATVPAREGREASWKAPLTLHGRNRSTGELSALGAKTDQRPGRVPEAPEAPRRRLQTSTEPTGLHFFASGQRMALMEEIEEEIVRTLATLRTTIKAQGFTQLQVQKVLGWGRSSISQILTRQKGLRFESFLRILKVVDVAPVAFYAELYGWPPSDEPESEKGADLDPSAQRREAGSARSGGCRAEKIAPERAQWPGAPRPPSGRE